MASTNTLLFLQGNHQCPINCWILYERLLGLPCSGSSCPDCAHSRQRPLLLIQEETITWERITEKDTQTDKDNTADVLSTLTNKLQSSWFERQTKRVHDILEEIYEVEQKVKDFNEASEHLLQEILEQAYGEDETQQQQIFDEESQHKKDETAAEEQREPEIPVTILGSMVAPFLAHRSTLNSLGETCKELHGVCTQQDNPLPPWPETILFASDGSSLWSVAFSTDHLLLVAGGNDGRIRIWHRRKGLLAPLHAHLGRVYTIVFDPTGQYMASGSGDGEVKIWNLVAATQAINNPDIDIDTDNDEEIWTCFRLETNSPHIDCLAFDPGGDILASSGDGTVRLWNVHTGTCLASLREDVRVVESVAFSPDGKMVAAGNWDNKVSLWDVGAERMFGAAVESTCVHSVSFSPIFRHINDRLREYHLCSATDHRNLKLWKIFDHVTTTARYRRDTNYTSLVGHSDAVWSVVFSPNGQWIASGSEDGTCRIWSAASGRCLAVFSGLDLESSVHAVAFSPCNGYVAAASGDGSVDLKRVSVV